MSWFVPAFDLWLNVTIAGLALTAAASLAVLMIRQPARKIRVIQLVLLGLLLLPALALLPGYPRVAWWPAVREIEPVALQTKSPPAKPGAAPGSVPQRVQPPALPGGSSMIPRVDPVVPATAQPTIDETPRATAAPPTVPQPTEPIATTPTPTAHSARDTTTSPTRVSPSAATTPYKSADFELPDYRLLVVSAYLLGVALFACWWLIGRIALWRLLQTATPAEPQLRALLDDVAANHAGQLMANAVRLLVSPRAAQPCAFGWLRPTIVLPQRVVHELMPVQLRLALSHEWSHVARGDIRTWMLAGVVRLVHFHQPLVWLLRRELRVSQDYLADAAAAGSATPEDYAELLTTLSRMLRPTPLSPGLGIAPRQSELYRRVVMLVDQTRPLEHTIPRRWNVAAIALGIALIAGVATLRAEPEQHQPALSPAKPAPAERQSDSEPALTPDATPGEPALAQPKTRKELLNDSADRRDVALQLVTIGRQLETILKIRKGLQLRLSNGDQSLEDRQQLEKALAGVDNNIADTSQRFVEMQAHFDAASLKENARASAAAADWEQSGDKRRLLEASWAELDQLMKLRDQVLQQAAEQTDSKRRASYESRLSEIDFKRVEIAHRIEELLQPVASRSVATTNDQQPEERLGIQLGPQQLAEMILQSDPQINELKRTLAKKELVLAQARSSGATPEVLKAAHQEVLQIEELIEELKSHRMPGLLDLVGGGSTQANRRAAGSQPFSGRIRPGDILGIEIVGGFPGQQPPTRTVEPDGNVVLGAVYGPASRVNVAGLKLIEAGQTITKKLKEVLKNPQVVVTYEGHNDGVVAEGAPADATSGQGKPAPATEPAVLQPLDTIEIILPLGRTRSYLTDSFGKPGEARASSNLPVSGTYVIEPDGRVALPEAGGRVKLAGLTEKEAGKQLREHLSVHLFPRIALPTVTVFRRGRAVFPDGKQPTADYKIAPGDTVLASTYLPLDPMVIDSDGRFPLDIWNGKPVEKVPVAGLTLEEAQAALRKAFVWKAGPGGGISGSETDQTAPWLLTLGGWREEADPQVIDRIEGTDATQLLRMQEEMQELKAMIRRLQAE